MLLQSCSTSAEAGLGAAPAAIAGSERAQTLQKEGRYFVQRRLHKRLAPDRMSDWD